MNGQRRLRWLLAVVAALLVLRWIVPPGSSGAANAVAEPIVRAPVATVAALPVPLTDGGDLPHATALPDGEGEVASNPFAVRTSPAPPPLPVVVARAPAIVQAPVPAADSPPSSPFTVIGTWDDGSGLAAFIASPRTTLLARPGVLLMGEYSVIAVTKQQVTLLHVPSRRDVRLLVPRAPGA